ncbi:hypothetical protein CMS2979 [Clavibacter sepedonicus]|uniref:Uncharacterized protein n=1 Tax=Clavibacter sepedonicus TaxID=31964 RepID=B0RCV9_CLASE|nr:hypothetical protein CMS2979 [Clavibacter sepedonicus]
MLHHPRHGRVQRGLAADPDTLALVVAGIGVELEGQRVSGRCSVRDHVPEHGPVFYLDPPVAGLEVRPRVDADVAHEAVDAARHLVHRGLSFVESIEWERPAALVDERKRGVRQGLKPRSRRHAIIAARSAREYHGLQRATTGLTRPRYCVTDLISAL